MAGRLLAEAAFYRNITYDLCGLCPHACFFGVMGLVVVTIPAAAIPVTPTSTIPFHENRFALVMDDVFAAIGTAADTPYSGAVTMAAIGCAVLACANGGRRRHRRLAQAI